MIAQDQKEGHVVHDEADLLTVREVAKQLRVDDTTVRRWIKNGVLEAISLPHRGTRVNSMEVSIPVLQRLIPLFIILPLEYCT